jgi:DNA polymerase-4
MEQLIKELENDLHQKCRDRIVRKAFVKVKFSDFTHTTCECVTRCPELETFFRLLREARSRKELPVRLLGAGVRFVEADPAASNLQTELEF